MRTFLFLGTILIVVAGLPAVAADSNEDAVTEKGEI